MTWFAVGAAATTVVGGVVSNISGNHAKSAANANALQNNAAAWTQNVNDNKAIREADLQNMIRTGYKAGILNMQRGQAKQEAAASGFNINRAGLITKGTADANSFAAGQVGSSVDAVYNDIQQKQEDASNQVDKNYLIQESNFDLQMHDILTQGVDAQRSAHQVTINDPTLQEGPSLSESLFSSALQIGGSYLSSNMSLGLGNSTAGAKATATIKATGVF